MQRLERDVGLTAESLALFIRFWLTITPPLPNDAQAAAQAKDTILRGIKKRLRTGK